MQYFSTIKINVPHKITKENKNILRSLEKVQTPRLVQCISKTKRHQKSTTQLAKQMIP